MSIAATLPFIDEHAIEIDADPASVWAAVLDVASRSFSHRRGESLARALGCADRAASGPLSTVGATRPGFHVVSSIPEQELVLEGRHRFSTYALSFRLSPAGDGRVRVQAETRAVFPGVAGRGYRALVIGTGGHVVVVKRMLAAVRRRAERRA